MDTRTGELYDLETLKEMAAQYPSQKEVPQNIQQAIDRLPPKERPHFMPVRRDLTDQEKADHQVKLYAPCACGSGKKFKFCCHNKAAQGTPAATTTEGETDAA